MPGDMSSKHRIGEKEIVDIVNIDRFRPSLKCDLFIPSYVHSLSIATEFVYNYVFSRFPQDYFRTIHVTGKHPFEDFRRLQKGDLAIRQNPSASISYSIQYDFNDNNLDYNLLSTNKYLKKSQWQRSFFKCPSKGIYIGMDLEAMMINYNFRFRTNTRAQQLDLFNRLRKVFRLGCTETVDIDCDFHLDNEMTLEIAKEAGFMVDTSTGEVSDPWNFTRFLNSYSQMPILYKLRLINQKYEYFLRMRNLPVHLDFQNPLDVDDGSQTGMTTTDFIVEFQIAMRFPAPRTFALYNEGNWSHGIKVEKDEGIKVYSMKVLDIPEENLKHWPMYGHSDYLADEDEVVVQDIDIKELFKAPVDIKVDTSLDDIIQDAIDQFISPDTFVEVAVYINDLAINGTGRIPIRMDWENRKIILPSGITNSYFYLAIYIDRDYVNSKVVEKTNAQYNRIIQSKRESDKPLEQATREAYVQTHYIEQDKLPDTNLPKPKGKKAKFFVN